MKRSILVLTAALALIYPTDSFAGDSSKKNKDKSKVGYVSFALQSPAEFSAGNDVYSAPGGSLDLMFHQKMYDAGLEWSNFSAPDSADSRKFSLSNIHLQAGIHLYGPAYFKGGYGLSFLHVGNQPSMLVGGCWKWGFGLKFHFAKGFYGSVETNRWDGPGPVGFRSQSIGVEYHF